MWIFFFFPRNLCWWFFPHSIWNDYFSVFFCIQCNGIFSLLSFLSVLLLRSQLFQPFCHLRSLLSAVSLLPMEHSDVLFLFFWLASRDPRGQPIEYRCLKDETQILESDRSLCRAHLCLLAHHSQPQLPHWQNVDEHRHRTLQSWEFIAACSTTSKPMQRSAVTIRAEVLGWSCLYKIILLLHTIYKHSDV